MRSKQFVVLLVLVSIVGVVVSLAAWCFLELIHQIQQEVFTHLPHALGYSNAPVWWPLPVLAIAGVLAALAISKLPGNGGHIPAFGLNAGGPPAPVELPGIILAGLASIGLGVVIGPEAPLIALGAGLGVIAIRRVRSGATNLVVTLVAASGSFAAVAFVFSSPLAAAVIMIEVTAIGGPRLRLVLVPGLLAAGIGSLVSVGMGSFTGLSSSAYAISALPLPAFGHPHLGNFAWTIALAIAVAAVTSVIMRGGLGVLAIAKPRPLVVLPVAGLVIAGTLIWTGLTSALFSQATNHTVDDVLFSGQDQLPGLVANAGTYSVGALALLVLCKGAAYSLSLGGFRGGPTFPAMFLGAAAGIMASHLPGFPITAGVAVGIAAGVSSVLRLPLSAVVIASVLTAKSGDGVVPLVIVGSVVAIMVTLLLSPRPSAAPEPSAYPASAALGFGVARERLGRVRQRADLTGKRRDQRGLRGRALQLPDGGLERRDRTADRLGLCREVTLGRAHDRLRVALHLLEGCRDPARAVFDHVHVLEVLHRCLEIVQRGAERRLAAAAAAAEHRRDGQRQNDRGPWCLHA